MAVKAPKISSYSEYYYIAEDGCWIWKRGTSGNGYGNYGNKGAHRVFYELFVEDISPGYQIDHLCRKRNCVNPDHLEQVTPKENIARGLVHRGPNMGGIYQLAKTECRRGHEYNEENTTIKTRKNGLNYRECKTCRKEYY